MQRATQSKERTERASVIEQARIDVLGYQSENKGKDLDKSQLKTVLDTYFKDVPDLTEMSATDILNRELETLAKYGTHNITVKEIFNGKLSGENQTKTATVEEINSKIGTVVTGYSAKNLEWQVFYADENETFLISKSLAKENNVIPTDINTYNADIETLSYGANWNSKWLHKREIESVTSNYDNTKAATFLCNPENWIEYKVAPATYAVGGPTLDLLIASWNISQNSNVNILDTDISAQYGYGSYMPDEFWNQHLLTANINNGVYCEGTGVYLLASPSWNSGEYLNSCFLRSVSEDGMVGSCLISSSYYEGQGGCRPIVSIPTSKISVNGDNVIVLP